MHSSLGRAQLRRVVEATGPVENLKMLAPRGEPLAKFQSAALERPNPPTHAQEQRGGGKDIARAPDRLTTAPEKNSGFESRGGTPGEILVAGVGKDSPPHTRLQASGGRQGGDCGALQDCYGPWEI